MSSVEHAATAVSWSANTLPRAEASVLPPVALLPVDPEHYIDRVEITCGGMGRIFAAYDTRLRRRVAIKELRVPHPDLAERFEREALLTARLQHPSIVSIHEAGKWPSGDPFFAMKLVPGRPLDQIVNATRCLDEKLALLPHVLAVADALAYAHRQRVIHRDLKPHNVMIGEFGETVVIDWGLGKDLADTAQHDAGPYRSTASPGHTQTGEILGTPAYMPPEQAEGAAVDERADVYAIGAMLYHVLSGCAPYAGRTTVEILDALKHQAPIPLGTREPGVPLDLLAIVERAMARDPRGRYPTARELADDLRRFQAGQLVGAHRYSRRQLVRRWLGRNRISVVVASVAALILATFGGISIQRILVEQRRSAAAETTAEHNRADAEGLLDFMLNDLNDKLSGLGKLDILGEVADKARDYYRRRPPSRDRQAQWNLAKTLRNIGDVLQSKRDLIGALDVYHQSLAITEILMVTDPSDERARRSVGNSYLRIGEVLDATGDIAGALAVNRAALVIAEQVVARAPARKRELLVAQVKVGDDLLRNGDTAGAFDHFHSCLEVALTTGIARDAMVCHDRMGAVLAAKGDPTGALAEARASLEIGERLADPKDARSQLDVSNLHGRVGAWLSELDDHEAALVEFRKEQATVAAIVAQEPGNIEWQGDLGLSIRRISEELIALHKTDEALGEIGSYAPTARTLAKDHPDALALGANVIVLRKLAADALFEQHHYATALAEYQAVLAAWQQLAGGAHGDLDGEFDQFPMQHKIGDVLAAQHDFDGALVRYEAELPTLVSFIKRDPVNATWLHELFEVHRSIGDVRMARHDRSGALAAYREAIAVGESLVKRNPKWQSTIEALRARIVSN
jgi:tetratricopeptide (TPR) repeat protein